MEPTEPEPVTKLLLRWRAGDQECSHRLLPLVECELRRIAHCYLGRGRNRAQCLAVAARLMRHILVDHAREQRAGKRGGAQLLALDDALAAPAGFDPGNARVVELRTSTVDGTAEMLGVHPETMACDWNLAETWLKRELSPKGAHAG